MPVRRGIEGSEDHHILAVVSRVSLALRVVTVSSHSRRVHLLLRSILRMIPSVLPHLSAFLAMFVFFAGLGMALFAGDTTRVLQAT